MDLKKYLFQEEELKKTLGEEKFNDLKKTITNAVVENNIHYRKLLMIDLFDYIIKSLEIEKINFNNQIQEEKGMEKNVLNNLLAIVSTLKPYEWQQFKNYVDKKYSSKQDVTPMPSIEELKDYSSFDFPNVNNQQSECDKETNRKEDIEIHIDLKELTKKIHEAVLQNINDVTVKDSCEEVMEDTTTVYYCIKNGKFLWDTERFEEADFEVTELSNIGKLLDLINEKELSKEDLNLIFNTIKSSVDMR